MRILVLTTSYPLFAKSASGIFVKRLLDDMPEDIQCQVLAPADPRAGVSGTGRGNISIVPFRYAPGFLSNLAHRPGGIPVALKRNWFLYSVVPFFLLAMLLTTLRHARKVDIIHANWAISGVIAGLVGRVTGIPVVTTLRGSDVPQAGTKSFSRWLLSKSLALSTRVVTVSEAFEQKIKAEFPGYSDKVTMIENGVGDEFLSLAARRSVPAKIANLLTVGSLIPRKGMQQILEALSSLAGERNFQLRIAGEGPLRKSLEKQAQDLGIDDRVEFMGMVESDRMPALLKQADVFILASHREGRPNVVLEAMATGLAVIASDIEGVNELVVDGKTGLLFRDGDSHALGACIEKMLGDPAQAYEYGLAGAARIAEKELHWCNAAQRYVELYRTCITEQVAGKY